MTKDKWKNMLDTAKVINKFKNKGNKENSE